MDEMLEEPKNNGKILHGQLRWGLKFSGQRKKSCQSAVTQMSGFLQFYNIRNKMIKIWFYSNINFMGMNIFSSLKMNNYANARPSTILNNGQ